MIILLALIYCGSEGLCDLSEIAQLVSNRVGILSLGKVSQRQTSFLTLEIGRGLWSSVSAGDISIPEPSGSAGTSPVS